MKTTEIPYYPNDDRQIIIDTNEFVTDLNKRFVIKAAAMNIRDGKFTVTKDIYGNTQYDELNAGTLVQIPKTKRKLTAGIGQNGKLATGLDVYVSNPYKDEENLHGKWKEVLFGKSKALLQHLLEYEHNVEFNYYTNMIGADEAVKKGQEKYFYQTPQSRIALTNGSNILNMRNPIDRVNYYMLLSHPAVANSYAELEGGTNLQARWYIVDNDEKAKVQVQRKEKSRKLAYMLVTLQDDDEGQPLVDMVKALYLDEARDKSLTPDKAISILEQYGAISEGYNLIEEFFNMRKNDDTRKMFEAYVTLTDLITYAIVQYKDGSIVWKKRLDDGSTTTFTRSDRESMVNSFLLNPSHKNDVLDMITQLSNFRS